jgi:hypothetical protein
VLMSLEMGRVRFGVRSGRRQISSTNQEKKFHGRGLKFDWPHDQLKKKIDEICGESDIDPPIRLHCQGSARHVVREDPKNSAQTTCQCSPFVSWVLFPLGTLIIQSVELRYATLCSVALGVA